MTLRVLLGGPCSWVFSFLKPNASSFLVSPKMVMYMYNFVINIFLLILFNLTSTFICSLSLELSILKWAFGKPSTVVSIWLVMKAMALFAFPIFSAWHANRHSWLPFPDLCWLLLYITYLTVFAIFPVQEVIQHNLPPASSIIILAEQVWSVAWHGINFYYYDSRIYNFTEINIHIKLKKLNNSNSTNLQVAWANLGGPHLYLH